MLIILISLLFSVIISPLFCTCRAVPLNSITPVGETTVNIWPLPSQFTSGNETLLLDPDVSLAVGGSGGSSVIVKEAFQRYRGIIFKHASRRNVVYNIKKIMIIVQSNNEELRLGVDESYSLSVMKSDGHSIVGQVKIEANTVYGALRGLETFSQICAFDYGSKSVQVYKAPWNIVDKPKFIYRGLMIDTSRHYLPIDVIKHVIESMSFAKLNVLHWHIIDKESFPLEVPTYPNLWKGAYTEWERYAVEDAHEIVNFAKARGIHVMAEIDVPGHAESWGTGYPDLWPSPSCKQPLDVSKNSTFDMISGIVTDMRKIFPFELFHLGGDEVNTDCWNSTSHVKQWLQERNMTVEEAYEYFVLRAQEIAISRGWAPVHWEETFNTFADKLNTRTVVHNWLGPGVCPKVVAKGFKCIYSNQAAWYLDHLDLPWHKFYDVDPLDGISDASTKQLVIGGEVCMWGETVDPSNLQQTIWPRAAAAAERLWSYMDNATLGNITATVLPRYQYFRCLLNRRGVQAAPATNYYARSAPTNQGSCYEQ